MPTPLRIIMPYLDNPAWTRQALDDCLAQTLDTQILLIDNGSQSEARALGDAYALTTNGRVLVWHHSPPFPALAAVWNRALRWAWESGAEEALVVNNDVRLAPWTYRLLSEVLRDTQAFMVTAVSVTEPQFNAYITGGEVVAEAALGQVTDARQDGTHTGYPCGGPDFSCFLLTKEGHTRYPFDEGFVPAYCEDLDLHRRMMLGGDGHRIFGVNLPFLHYGSGTLKGVSNERREQLDRLITQGSRVHYQQKWGGPPNAETFLSPFGRQEPLDAPVGTPLTTPELQASLRG